MGSIDVARRQYRRELAARGVSAEVKSAGVHESGTTVVTWTDGPSENVLRSWPRPQVTSVLFRRNYSASVWAQALVVAAAATPIEWERCHPLLVFKTMSLDSAQDWNRPIRAARKLLAPIDLRDERAPFELAIAAQAETLLTLAAVDRATVIRDGGLTESRWIHTALLNQLIALGGPAGLALLVR